MKKSIVAMVFVLAMSVSGLAYAASITIDIPLPRIVITAPPALVVIPGTYVYLAPDIELDLFFYGGYWYRLYDGRWYRSYKYAGPWVFMPGPKVPPALLKLPPGYRKLPRGERLRHEDVNKHWRKWERERRWDKPKPVPPPPPVVVQPAPAAATTKSDDKGKDKGKDKDKYK